LVLVIVFLNQVLHGSDWVEIYWYCNVAGFLLAFGLLFRFAPLVNAVLITAIPSQFLWIWDFFLNMFGHGLGRTAELFSGTSLFIFVISITLHVLIIPISAYGSYKLGFSKSSFWYAWLIFVLILMSATFFLTDVDDNLNCVFYGCDLVYGTFFYPGKAFSQLAYVLGYWSVLCVVSYGVLGFLGKKLHIYRK